MSTLREDLNKLVKYCGFAQKAKLTGKIKVVIENGEIKRVIIEDDRSNIPES